MTQMTHRRFEDTIMYVKWWAKTEADRRPLYDALKEFTSLIRRDEPETLTYLVYTPVGDTPNQPPVSNREIFFIESYQSETAFEKHLASFNEHVGVPYKDKFVPLPDNPDASFLLVDNGARYRQQPGGPAAGFIRPDGYKDATITQYVKWWVKEGMDKKAVLDGLYDFFAWAKENEPGTLVYFFTDPEHGKTWPPVNHGEILFVAAYRDKAAQQLHFDHWNNRFLSRYKDYFVASANDPDLPFITVENIKLLDGFVRERAWE